MPPSIISLTIGSRIIIHYLENITEEATLTTKHGGTLLGSIR